MAKQRVKTIRIFTPMFNAIVGSMDRKEPSLATAKLARLLNTKKQITTVTDLCLKKSKKNPLAGVFYYPGY